MIIVQALAFGELRDAVAQQDTAQSQLTGRGVQALQSGEGAIEVLYLPEKPWANRPVDQAGNLVGDRVVGWPVCLIPALIWAAKTIAIIRNTRRCIAAAKRGECAKLRFWRVAPGA